MEQTIFSHYYKNRSMRRIESSKRNFFFFKINNPVLHHSNTPVVSFRKFLLPMILAFVFILTNTAFPSVITERQEPLPIKVGAYLNDPKIFMNADGKVSGFWPDLIEHIAKTENWKIEYMWGTWNEGLDHLKNKEIGIMPDVAFTEKRSKLYTFSEDSVLMSWAKVYVSKENAEIQSITDLKSKKIAALKESTNLDGPDGLREITRLFNINCTFLELDNYTEIFKAVEENRADAGITNRNFGNKNANKFNLKKTPIIFNPVNIKFAFPKDAESTPYLSEKIDYHIKQLIQDEHSIYYRLLQKYFEAKIAEKTVEVIPRWLNTTLKSIAALFIFFILVIILSRIQVRRKTNEIRIKSESLQEALEKGKELEIIINHSPAVVFLWRAEEGWPVEYVSDNIDQLGYTADDFISGRVPYAQLVYNEDLQRVAEEVKKYSKEDVTEFSQKYRIVTRDGQVRWIDDRTFIRREENGRITHYQGIILDITASKSVAEKAQQLGAIIEQSLNEIYIFDINTLKFIHVNKGAIQNLGYSLDELRHLTPLDIKPEFTVEPFKTLVDPLLSGKKDIIVFSTFHRRKDGTQYPVEVHLQLSTFASKPVFLAIILDVTERKKTEEELHKYRDHLEELVNAKTKDLMESRQALVSLVEDVNEINERLAQANTKLQELDQLKSMFIASMSHELRTPLNSIIGFTGIILQGLTGDITEEQRKQLSIVKSSGSHLLALINDVIDVSKIEAGKVDLFIEEFDLCAVLLEVKDSFAVAAEQKGLDLSLEMPEKLIIKTDERRIKQIIMNLVSNAVKFTDKGSVRMIAESKEKSEIRNPKSEIVVSDTGIGIKEEDTDKLFKPFSRIPAEGVLQEGTGLGLYLSQKIANLLGGEIKAKSEFGKGSVFTFSLPRK